MKVIDEQVARLIKDSQCNTDKRYRLPEFDLKKLIDHIQKLSDQAPGGIVQLVIDLFCGAGGVSHGIELATSQDKKCSAIIAGINHDAIAIYSQSTNHPLAYYTTEDIRIANLVPIKELVKIVRARFPQCPIFIWASLECTNHSNAKGGQSRDEDSRTLAWDLNRYITDLDPDGIWIENVKEFGEWGPLVEKEEWKKRGKKVKPSEAPVKENAQKEYYWKKINAGEIGVCPLQFKYDGKGNSKRLIAYGPIMVPHKQFKGIFFEAWMKEVCILNDGYHYQKRMLNAADFGAPTNRHRFFVIIMRKGWPIAWPEITHTKEGGEGLYKKKKHIPVKTCLHFDVEGRSIFELGHVKSPRTWHRIYKGLVRFIAGGTESFEAQKKIGIDRFFLTKYMGNDEKTGDNPGLSVNVPGPVINTHGRLGLVEACELSKFHISKYYSSHNNTDDNAGQSVDKPSGTVTTRGAGALVESCFLDVVYKTGTPSSVHKPCPVVRTKDGLYLVEAEDAKYFLLNYQGESHSSSIDSPGPALMTKEKLGLMGVKYFIYKCYSGGGTSGSIDAPCDVITPIPKPQLIQVDGWLGQDQYGNIGTPLENPSPPIMASRHNHYLINPSWYGSCSDTDKPCITVVARQDKAPIYLVAADQAENVRIAVPVYDDDSDIVIKIKEFMAIYNIYDIKKRMLLIPELLKIQSFPENYFLAGTQTDKKKFIGNAVPPLVAKAIAEAMYGRLVDFIMKELKIAA